jgi:hypothetical protein
MAKKASRVAPADKKAVQEIIGRALSDNKFLLALQKSPKNALAQYKLQAQTLAYIKEAIHLKLELDEIQALLEKLLGGTVRGG